MATLGETLYSKWEGPGYFSYSATPYGGNVPYGDQQITYDDYVKGLQETIAKQDWLKSAGLISGKYFGGTWVDQQGKTHNENYVGPTYDANAYSRYQQDLSAAQARTGIYAQGYRDPTLSRFLPNAPTPSEQYYTPEFFGTLAKSQQEALKTKYPGTYANYGIAAPAGQQEVAFGGGFGTIPTGSAGAINLQNPMPATATNIPAGATLISGPSGLQGLTEAQIYRDPNSKNIYKLPSTPIAADSIKSQTSLQVGSPTSTSTAADSLAAGAAQSAATQQAQLDAQAAANAELSAISAKTAEQQQADALTARINALLPQTQGQAAALTEEEKKRGVDTKTTELASINSRIATGLAEYTALKNNYALAQATLQSDASPFRGQGRGIPLGLVRGQEAKTSAQVQYDQTNTLNTKAAEIGLLQAQSLGLQGQIEAAQEAAQKAVDLKYSGIEEEIAVKQAQLALLQPTLDKQEKQQAAALDRYYEQRKIDIAEAKAKSKTNVTEALQYGVKTQYTNRNGKFYRTMDGKEYNSEAEFFADAKVSTFTEAYQKGLVTDLSGIAMADRDFVAQLRAKYFDAGISLNDTADQAIQKLQSSPSYQKETYIKPEGEGGLTDAQINTTVNQIAGAFDNEPIVKAYNTTQEGYQTVQKIGVNTKSPADDIAFIYAFAKIMDPNSVVREGEYNTIQRYAQSWADTFGFTAKRIFSNTNFLTADAKQKMLNALKPKVETLEAQYNQVRTEYQRQMDDARAGVPRTITDYSITDTADKATVEKMRSDGYSDADIEQILGRSISFKGVGGDTNSASRIAAAIRQVESGGNYSAKGGSGESGAYQFMPSTWKIWAKTYLGNANAPMTKSNQDKVATAKINSLLKQGYSAREIALIWNGGSPTVKKGVNKYGVKYDTLAYANKVLKALQG